MTTTDGASVGDILDASCLYRVWIRSKMVGNHRKHMMAKYTSRQPTNIIL